MQTLVDICLNAMANDGLRTSKISKISLLPDHLALSYGKERHKRLQREINNLFPALPGTTRDYFTLDHLWGFRIPSRTLRCSNLQIDFQFVPVCNGNTRRLIRFSYADGNLGRSLESAAMPWHHRHERRRVCPECLTRGSLWLNLNGVSQYYHCDSKLGGCTKVFFEPGQIRF